MNPAPGRRAKCRPGKLGVAVGEGSSEPGPVSGLHLQREHPRQKAQLMPRAGRYPKVRAEVTGPESAWLWSKSPMPLCLCRPPSPLRARCRGPAGWCLLTWPVPSTRKWPRDGPGHLRKTTASMPSEVPSLGTCAARAPAVLRTHLLTLQALERPLVRLDIWPLMSPDVRAPAWRASLLSGKSGAATSSVCPAQTPPMRRRK